MQQEKERDLSKYSTTKRDHTHIMLIVARNYAGELLQDRYSNLLLFDTLDEASVRNPQHKFT